MRWVVNVSEEEREKKVESYESRVELFGEGARRGERGGEEEEEGKEEAMKM